MRKARRRRKLSMTSLIDVIFLLLLFFMLSSTFTRFSEVELSAAGSGGAASATRPLFLQLGTETLRLNGQTVELGRLSEALGQQPETGDSAARRLLVALQPGVTAQRLTDLLVVLRAVPGLAPTILGAS